jgi:hypothetical protein
MNTKKAYVMSCLIGSLQQELKMKYSEIKDRIKNPHKYYVFVDECSQEFADFVSALETAHVKLRKKCNDMKSQPSPDKDYVYHSYMEDTGKFFCMYTLMDIHPS